MRARRCHVVLACCAGLASTALVACGGGERQDAGEPDRAYEVEVVSATFPEKQELAERSALELVLKNVDTETIPDIAVTVKGFYRRMSDPGLDDPNRPVFMINGVAKQIGGFRDVKLDAPDGGENALVGTWTLGELEPGAERRFRWGVTAVRPGPYKISYSVSAGTGGKARAVDISGKQPRGAFAGEVTDAPPQTRIADDGRGVVPDN